MAQAAYQASLWTDSPHLRSETDFRQVSFAHLSPAQHLKGDFSAKTCPETRDSIRHRNNFYYGSWEVILSISGLRVHSVLRSIGIILTFKVLQKLQVLLSPTSSYVASKLRSKWPLISILLTNKSAHWVWSPAISETTSPSWIHGYETRYRMDFKNVRQPPKQENEKISSPDRSTPHLLHKRRHIAKPNARATLPSSRLVTGCVCVTETWNRQGIKDEELALTWTGWLEKATLML